MTTAKTFEELKALVRQGLMVRSHSSQVKQGDVFVAVPGAVVDGAKYIPRALEQGAAYVVAENGAHWSADADAQLITHPRPAEALGQLAAAWFGTENLELPIVGITGTNGKTTITYLLEHLLMAAGRKVGVVGTVSYRWPGLQLEATRTTPDTWKLHELVANMAKAKVDAAVMEVSSHALAQDRAAGLRFPVAVFTNVTQDHLDYHADLDDYFEAKRRLFRDLPPEGKTGVANWDDERGRVLLKTHAPAIGFGLTNPPADVEGVHGTILENTASGLRLSMRWKDQEWELKSPMVGAFNASNLLAAQAAGLALGLTPAQMSSLANCTGAPGRLERVPNKKRLDIFIDYAHTPDALDNVLRALREVSTGRILTAFGCGGNRDRAKRPIMGRAVCAHTDIAILTSDNPRDEDPLAIMADVRPGMQGCRAVIEEPDRSEAIRKAIGQMRPGDVLLIAGKGHETYQEIKGVKHPYHDARVVQEILG